MKVEKALDMEFINKFAEQFRELYITAVTEYNNLNTDNTLDRFNTFFLEKLAKIEKDADNITR